jgi:hypothetical protein
MAQSLGCFPDLSISFSADCAVFKNALNAKTIGNARRNPFKATAVTDRRYKTLAEISQNVCGRFMPHDG